MAAANEGGLIHATGGTLLFTNLSSNGQGGQITVDSSDPENARIRGCMMEGGAVWDLEFTRPLGWEPRSGEWPCELVFLADVRLPVMVQLADGLMFTSDRTQRVYGRRA